jgi:NADH dehydrogenase
MSYDYLVIAFGAEPYHFEIPGLQGAAFEFKTFTDALKLRDAIWESTTDARAGDTHIVIGGGGSTGVELAGELAEWLCRNPKQPRKAGHTTITLVEAAPTILPGLDSRVIRKAEQRLKSLGVTMLTNHSIEKIIDHTIWFRGGASAPFDLFVWVGGTRAHHVAEALALKTARRGHVTVGPSLSCIPQTADLAVSGKVYGIGDVTCFYDTKTNKPVPGLARVAISQARRAARNILRDLRGEKPLEYRARDYPYIIPVGGKYAVAKVGPFVFSGFLAWVFKGLVELNYLISVMPNVLAIKMWLKGLKTFVRNDRLG